MSTVKKSLILSFISKYSQLAITFFSSIIIARLLTPEEIGIYSVVAGIVVVAHMLRDFGVSSYIIKEVDFDDAKCSAAFFVTATLSWSAGALLFFSATSLGDFFNREEVIPIVRLLAFNFLIIPFGSISLSLLRKKMDFNALLVVNVASAAVNAVTTISLAYLGFSYMSLAYSSVAGTLMTVVLSSYYRQKVAYLLPQLVDIRNVFGFGSQVSFTQMMNTSIAALPEILVGKYIGVTTVGLMSRAYGLTQLFHYGVTQAILPVLLPDLVNKKSIGESEVQSRYLDTISFMCCIGWPFFIFLAFAGESLIIFLFGENWAPASEFVVWFSAIAVINLTYNLSSELFIALDKPKEMFNCRLIINLISFLVMILSIQFGLLFFFVGLVFVRIFGLFITQYYLKKFCNLPVKLWLSALQLPFILLIIVASSLLLLKYFIDVLAVSNLFILLINSIVFAISFTIVILLTDSKFKKEILKIIIKKN